MPHVLLFCSYNRSISIPASFVVLSTIKMPQSSFILSAVRCHQKAPHPPPLLLPVWWGINSKTKCPVTYLYQLPYTVPWKYSYNTTWYCTVCGHRVGRNMLSWLRPVVLGWYFSIERALSFSTPLRSSAFIIDDFFRWLFCSYSWHSRVTLTRRFFSYLRYSY